jgi:hypothetical protein
MPPPPLLKVLAASSLLLTTAGNRARWSRGRRVPSFSRWFMYANLDFMSGVGIMDMFLIPSGSKMFLFM